MNRLTCAAVTVLAALLFCAPHPAWGEADKDLESLQAVHSRTAQQLRKHLATTKPGDGQYRLVLQGAVEGDDALMTLTRFAGQTRGVSTVPWWRQETQKEKFNFRHRDGGASVHRDKFLYTVNIPGDGDGLKIDGHRLGGTLTVDYRLDLPRDVRMPPGGRHLYTTDGRWSLVDQWYVGPRVTPRTQSYTLNAKVLPDVRRVHLVLHNGIDTRPLHLTATVPSGQWADVRVKAPTWNAGVHQADANDLRMKDGRLTGQLRVRFNPDAWWPKKVWYATYELDVPVDDGLAGGTFKASIAEGDYVKVSGQNKNGQRPSRSGPAGYTGTVTGTVLPMVVGRYETTGPLGKRQGRVVGGVLPPTSRPEKRLTAPPGEPAGRATTLYNQIRAMRMMLSRPGYPMHQALSACDMPAPTWDTPNPAARAAYLRRLASIAQQAGRELHKAPAKGRPAAKNPHFGPYFGRPKALESDAEGVVKLPTVRDAGRQTWRYAGTWRVLGPLATLPSHHQPLIDMPGLIPADGAGRTIDPNALGRSYRGAKTLTWQTVQTSPDGTLLPPPWTWNKKGRLDKPGRENSSWYATLHVESPVAQEVYLAVDAHDHALLWANDQLVWQDTERQRNYRTLRPAVFRVRLRKGINRLLLRVRDDRAESFTRVSFCVAGASDAVTPPPPETATAKQTTSPAPEPPVAWDLDKGVNVAFSTPVEGARGRPVVADGMVFIAARPNDLVCLDIKTGQQLWRRSANALELVNAEAAKAFETADAKQRKDLIEKHLGKAFARGEITSPVWDGKRVYLHTGQGVLACFDAEGKRHWMHRTYMPHAAVTIMDGNVIVEGAALDDWAKANDIETDGFSGKTVKRAGHNYGSSSNHTVDRLRKLRDGRRHGLMAVTSKGKVAWARPAAGTFAGPPIRMDLPGPDGKTQPVLITRSAEAYDPSDGTRLRELIDLGMWDWLAATTDGRRLFSAWEGGRAGADMWLSGSGLGSRTMWNATRLHAYVAGGPNDGCADGTHFFVWRRVGEHAKHCPATRLQLDVFNAATGQRVGWVKPAISGTNRAVQPVKIGNYLYLADTRGGAHSGGTPPERQVVVISADAQPVLLARNATPNISAPPVACENGLLMRCGDSIVRVAIDGEDGLAYQEKVLARHVFERIYDEPADRVAEQPEPLAATPGRDTPVMRLAGGASLSDWLVAGPFPKNANTPPEDGLTARAGETLTIGKTSAKLTPLPDELISMKTTFHNDGRLDDWQIRRTVRRLDLSALSERGEGVYYLAAVVDNPRRRLMYSTMDHAGLTTYLAGRRIAAGQPLDLKAGMYPLVVRVDPDAFRRRRPTPPIDVTAAMKADSVTDVGWPTTWTVFGPIPEAGGAPKPVQLKSIPKTLELGESSFGRIALPTIGRTLDLTAIIDLPEGGKPDVGKTVRSTPVKQQQSAWAMAEITIPADGTLVVNASADWFMEWFVDGMQVYSTLSKGNMRAPTQLGAHTFSVSLDKGKHVVACRVKPGSKGWSVTSLGALTTDDPDALAKAHPSKGVRAAEPEWRVNLLFREVDHPADVSAVRRRQIRQAEAMLRRIARTRKGTPDARKANELLKTIDDKR